MSKSLVFILFSATLLAISCKWEAPLPKRLANFTIVPAGRVGPITMDSCRRETVLQLYGERAKLNYFDVPGGLSGEGITLFPKDSTRTMDIWYYKQYSDDFPAMFRVRGSHSEWKTSKGITLGMTLAEVEKINEKPFKLMPGDKPGQLTIADWGGGQITPSLGLIFKVNALIMQEEISSNDPALLGLNPTVWAMTTFFRKPVEVQQLPATPAVPAAPAGK